MTNKNILVKVMSVLMFIWAGINIIFAIICMVNVSQISNRTISKIEIIGSKFLGETSSVEKQINNLIGITIYLFVFAAILILVGIIGLAAKHKSAIIGFGFVALVNNIVMGGVLQYENMLLMILAIAVPALFILGGFLSKN